jgi:hypothetical protein
MRAVFVNRARGPAVFFLEKKTALPDLPQKRDAFLFPCEILLAMPGKDQRPDVFRAKHDFEAATFPAPKALEVLAGVSNGFEFREKHPVNRYRKNQNRQDRCENNHPAVYKAIHENVQPPSLPWGSTLLCVIKKELRCPFYFSASPKS